MDDSKIIELFFERSEQGIVELSNKYGMHARKVVSNVLNNRSDAEECVNDAFLSVWNSIPPVRPTNLGAFFIRIAKNIALNRLDYNSSQKRNSNYDTAIDELQEIIPSSDDVEAEMLKKELTNEINAFLEKLPKRDRILFVGRYWMGESLAELANKTGESEKGISVRLFRIRKKLNKHLEKERLL